jgi:hypothetical protein
MYIDMNRDMERVKALAERWGVTMQERGCENRPIKVNLNDQEQIQKVVERGTQTYYDTN